MIQLHDETLQLLICKRAENSPIAKFLAKTLPPDPRARFVWPQLAVAISQKYFRMRNTVLIALVLLMATIGLIALLLQVPFLDLSVVSILTQGFKYFMPEDWARGTAWVVGIAGVGLLGDLTNHTQEQRSLRFMPATQNRVYDFILGLALLEEQVFRSGSEQWTWVQRIRASLVFGAIHIVNIWYSLAAGIAISLTGFGFMLVYQWHYKRTKNQLIATAASATVHATYNVIAITVVFTTLIVAFFVP